MSSPRLDFGLTASHSDFLFTLLGEQENGMPLSVLSALTRANVDPWAEAARLEAMPREDAESELAETLSRVPGRTWDLSEAKNIAIRLVQLLQNAAHSPSSARVETAKDVGRLISYWLMWISFVIAISLSQPPHHASTANSATSNSSAGVTSLGDSTNKLSPHAGR